MTKAKRFDEFDHTCIVFGTEADLTDKERESLSRKPLPPLEDSPLANVDKYVADAQAAGSTEKFDDVPEDN